MQHSTIAVLDLHGWQKLQITLDLTLQCQVYPGESRSGWPAGKTFERVERKEPAGGQGNGLFRHAMLEARQPAGIAVFARHKPVPLAHQLVETRQPRGMIGIDGDRKPVEKTPTVAART